MRTWISDLHFARIEHGKHARQPSIRISIGLVGLVAILGIAFPAIAFAGQPDPKADPSPVIKILVYNMALAPAATLTAAEHEASRILSEAGVRAIWFECAAGKGDNETRETCQNGWGSINVGLRILGKPNSFADRAHDVQMGFTIFPALGSVYYDHRVRFAGDDRGLGLPKVLGCFIAHEIGHVLLGPNSHVHQGLMQAGWGERQIRQAISGDLLFTPDQARLMQTEARVRMSLGMDTHAQSSSLQEDRNETSTNDLAAKR